VPDVTGQQLDEARATLEDAGFKVKTTDQETTDRDPGTVLAQSPGAGGDAPQGSDVTLTVAREPSQVSVPDVKGEQDSDAIRILQDAGFRVATEKQDVSDLDQDGVVLEQDPKGNRQAKPGDVVSIVVGRFNPDLNPEPDTNTTTTTTPDGTATVPTPGAR